MPGLNNGYSPRMMFPLIALALVTLSVSLVDAAVVHMLGVSTGLCAVIHSSVLVIYIMENWSLLQDLERSKKELATTLEKMDMQSVINGTLKQQLYEIKIGIGALQQRAANQHNHDKNKLRMRSWSCTWREHWDSCSQSIDERVVLPDETKQ